MKGAFLPLFILAILFGTATAVITTQRSPGYRQDPRTRASNPTTTALPIPTPGSFYAQNTIVIDEATNDAVPVTSVILSLVQIEGAGFLAMHEDAGGIPGTVLGVTGLLPPGRTEYTTVSLVRAARNGEFLYGVLYLDDGDGMFDPVRDKRLLREDGSAAMITFGVEIE